MAVTLITTFNSRMQLTKYAQGGKWDREESLKAKSPMKVHKSDPRNEKGDTSKSKRPYIVVIIGEAP